MGVSVAVILTSALLPAAPRLVVWAGLAVAWIVGIVLAARSSRGLGLTPTDSLVERFGLFTIIVLGEVVLGAVAGLSVAERDAKTILTGLLRCANLWPAEARASRYQIARASSLNAIATRRFTGSATASS
jgi:low temperature requirement protein LtrA